MYRRASQFSVPLAAALLAAGCQPSQDELAARYSGVVQTYCLECHDYAGQEAGLSLEGIDLVHVAANAEIFENVARKLRGRQMPPSGGPRPDEETTDGFVAYLEQHLDAAALAAPNPGPASIHRLNRTEYGNAVRDLLALEVDAAEFLPADDEGYGFDNIADILRVSPSLLEQYLAASAKIAALAVGDPEVPAVTAVYRAPSDLPRPASRAALGTRGGI
jgi:mono/diheme cytochrome c family protein